jgi:Zn finger protein HypA/HybF involved in hydrogenase expression
MYILNAHPLMTQWEKMKYKCKKCGAEFDATSRVKCPNCGAEDWDCEPLSKYKLTQPVK